MSKILLTGSSGFLANVIKKQIELKNFVYELNRNTGHFKIDLRNAIPNFNYHFDTVIHSAGKAHLNPKTIQESKDFFDVNVNGTKNLLNALNKDLQKFIYISSVSVYGVSNGINLSENEPLQAKDPYGLSKIVAENLVQEWCYKNNVKYLILRLPLVAGLNPPGNLASMIKGIRRGYYFNIDGGGQKKSIVLASDISKFILIASEVGGIYNLTDGENPSFFDLSNCIAHQLKKKTIPNIPFKYAKILAKMGDIIGNKFPLNSDKLSKITSTLTFDDSKARGAFGWNPTPVLLGFNVIDNI
jgi:nucleoside-diphosphate-sugar epimerase